MKLKFFVFLVCMCSFFNLSAAAVPDVLPAFALNPEVLAKPQDMKCMQRLDALEPEAIKVCTEAAALGNKTALSDLSTMFTTYSVALFEGDGLEEDIPKAIEICTDAVVLGDKDAIRYLLLMEYEVEQRALAIVKAGPSFKGNWTGTFQTHHGPIQHTPENVKCGMMICSESVDINDSTFKAPLILETNSTRGEFLAALRLSGLID